MKKVAYLFSLIVIIYYTPILSALNWPNEPAGSTVLTDWGIDNPAGANGWGNSFNGPLPIVSDPTAPFSPSSVMRNSRTATSRTQGKLLFGLPHGTTKVYAAYWFKPSSPHYGWFGWYQKISLLQNHIYVKMFLRGGGKFGLSMIPNVATDNSHIKSGCIGDCNLPQNANDMSFELGKWHLVETYYDKSTTETSRDGSLIWWVDGILLGDHRNVNLTGNLEWFGLCNIWDADYPELPFEESVAYDHVRVSVPPGTISPLSFSTASLPAGNAGTAYSSSVKSQGGVSPYKYSMTAGTLPQGLTFYNTGYISGTPTQAGTFNLTISTTDSKISPETVTKQFTLIIKGTNGIKGEGFGTRGEGLKRELGVEHKTGSVRFDLPQQGSNVLSVYDFSGREIALIKGNNTNRLEWKYGAEVKEGVYFAKLNTGTGALIKRFVVTR